MNRPLPPSRPGPLDAGLFDPASPERSWTLPADWYFDPDIYRKEHAAIFHKSWWYQGHVADLPNPGDYLTGSVVDQEIFIIRGQDGELRAFYNVCSHRAHPLLEGQGNTRLIVCPYHQWCYQADGCFRGARGRDTLKAWIPENADLKPIRLEVYAGFLFVNLDPDARPMTELAGKLLKDIYAAIPRQNDLVRVVRRERDVAANWKTVIDNNHECYHCAVNHKSLMELVDYDNKAVWSDDGITFTHTVEKKSLDNSAYKLDAATVEQDALFGFIFPNLVPLWFPGPAERRHVPDHSNRPRDIAHPARLLLSVALRSPPSARSSSTGSRTRCSPRIRRFSSACRRGCIPRATARASSSSTATTRNSPSITCTSFSGTYMRR